MQVTNLYFKYLVIVKLNFSDYSLATILWQYEEIIGSRGVEKNYFIIHCPPPDFMYKYIHK